ncbi:MAG: hypothetical protein GTO26_02665 [Planctomycetales bacterium]|nr:hypothetical protein [Planctomycetales bacterium]NIO33896.1 hypothetical protein [Planctomycetales bacterium]NIO45704.1 hypothetical protein [Planctomycetales bacterium]NIP84542.1 hypothetical protein [Planctomycetales bacterium]
MDSIRKRPASPQRQPPAGNAPPHPGRPGGFDFTERIRAVCQDMVTRLPPLQHIDLRRVAISFCQARKAVPHGLQAALTPMRFEGGRTYTVRRGRRLGVQQIVDHQGVEMLYLLSFYLPRFQNLVFEEKLVTLLHELWHISPQFDGDLRRLPGRCYVHSSSEQQYDAAMARLAHQWLARQPPPELYAFLHKSFTQLQQEQGPVFGTRIAAPKLICLDET